MKIAKGKKIERIIIVTLVVIFHLISLTQCAIENYTLPQRQDHFNTENKNTFEQRFWINTANFIDFSSLSPPSSNSAILYISDFCDPIADLEGGAINEWSKELGAVGVEFEVRFAGRSLPVANFSSFDLQFQSIEQNLADLTLFFDYFSLNFPQFGEVKWVVVGEYLQGNIAIWLNEKNDNGIVGAIAVAAPVFAHLPFYQFQSFFSHLAGRECARLINNATKLTEQFFINYPSNSSSLKEEYGCGGVADDTHFLYVIAKLIQFGLSNYRNDVCNNMTSAANSNSDIVLAYADVIKNLLYLSGNTNCSNWDLSFDSLSLIGDQYADNISSFFLSCSSLGQFKTAGSEEGEEDEIIISSWLTVDWYLSVCFDLFGNTIPIVPQINITNFTYGAKQPWGRNFAFISTSSNPFHFLSVNETSLPLSHSFFIHSSQPFWEFIGGSEKNIGENITNARADVLSLLQIWLSSPSSPSPYNSPSPSPSSSPYNYSNDDDDEINAREWFFIFVAVVILFIIFALIVVACLQYFKRYKRTLPEIQHLVQ